jgi:hypothetical protein
MFALLLVDKWSKMLTFHVTFRDNNSKKLITLDDPVVLLEAIRVKFGLDRNDAILLQSKYEDDWLDVEDEQLEHLVDGTKLCFSRIANAQLVPEHAARKEIFKLFGNH